MREQGFGHGYLYDHDEQDAFSGQNYFPEGVSRPVFYTPADRGFERDLAKRVAYFTTLRAKRQSDQESD
jgi:putative ATPase